MPSESKTRGIAVAEALLTMLVAAVAVMTMARYFYPMQRDVDAVANGLRSNVEFARDLAISRNRVCGLKVLDRSSYEIYEKVPGTMSDDPSITNSYVIDISPIVFVGSPPKVEFRTDGLPSSGGDKVIKLSDGSKERTIVVRRKTGKALLI